MPNIVNFNNRQIVEPGAYSRIIGGVPVPAILDTYGAVTLIDTGSGNGFVNGAGINGELSNGAASVYQFNALQDAKNFMKGGILWDLMDYLWAPNAAGIGPQKMYFASASTTVAPRCTLSFNSGANTIQIISKNEGTAGNGVLNTSVLVSGFAAKLIAGLVDPTKYRVQISYGIYKGVDSNGVPYELSLSDIVNGNQVGIAITSPEFVTTTDIINWMTSDPTFNGLFQLGTVTGTTYTILPADLTALSSYQLFSGGTKVYSTTALDTLLQQIEELDNDMFILDDFGPTPNPVPTSTQIQNGINKGALSAFNQKIFSFVINTALYTEQAIYMGGGSVATEFNNNGGSGSIQIAQYYNSKLAIVVHSGVLVPATSNSTTLQRTLPSLYNAAMVCGRAAGLEPQVSITYKDIRVVGVSHLLKKNERETALLSGVLHLKNVPRLGWVINLGCNSMQINASQIYPDGSSPLIQTMRIIHQINKEIKINAAIRFVGGNLKTASAAEVKAFTEGYLTDITVQPDKDNLIISFQNVTVTLSNGSWNTRYCIFPNSEIDRLFFTGVILDPNISI